MSLDLLKKDIHLQSIADLTLSENKRTKSADDIVVVSHEAVYALHSFYATAKNQVTVLKGEELKVLDSSNDYWTLIQRVNDGVIGYIPSDNAETPSERLSRRNKLNNMISDLSEASLGSVNVASHVSRTSTTKNESKKRKKVTFSSSVTTFDSPIEGNLRDSSESANFLDRAISQARKLATNIYTSIENLSGKFSEISTDDKSCTVIEEFRNSMVSDDDLCTGLIVLKVFSGNHDFQATYKSVSATSSTTVSQLMYDSLLRFKIINRKNQLLKPNMPDSQSLGSSTMPRGNSRNDSLGELSEKKENLLSNYYLSVVYGDSKEIILRNSERIIDILEKLKSRSSVPGVSNSSQRQIIHLKSINANGMLSSISTPNDSDIRFLLNIKYCRTSDIDFGSTLYLRIYYFGSLTTEKDGLVSYKTISAMAGSSVESIIAKALKKFKVDHIDSNNNFSLWKAKQVEKHDAQISSNIKLIGYDLDFRLSNDMSLENIMKKILSNDYYELESARDLNFILCDPVITQKKSEVSLPHPDIYKEEKYFSPSLNDIAKPEEIQYLKSLLGKWDSSPEVIKSSKQVINPRLARVSSHERYLA
jgi:hypothetical protein